MKMTIELDAKDLTPPAAQALAAFLTIVEAPVSKRPRRTKAEIAADAAPVPEPSGGVPAAGPGEAPPALEPNGSALPDLDAVRTALRVHAKANGRDSAIKVLKDHGADSVSSLAPERIDDVMKALAA